ncbi:hypothetical protein GCM10011315_34990 [Roseovarius pacificus]|nr:hypothetical protein GCM10011315_34990 [Roseovarius pacificus]
MQLVSPPKRLCRVNHPRILQLLPVRQIAQGFQAEGGKEPVGGDKGIMQIRKTSSGPRRKAAFSVVARAMDLRTDLEYNRSAVANYAKRKQQGRAVSTCRTEGPVNNLANTRMGKKQRMRWSPRGSHRVAAVRAAVLDGRLSADQLAAA